jgi:spore coat protein U-like protein
MKTSLTLFTLRRLMAASCAVLSHSAWAAYSCSVTVTSPTVAYNGATNANTNATGSAVLTCTRATTDANSLTYRLKADNGANINGTTRRARLGATANYLNYALTRSATCGNASNWYAPVTGTTNVITGTLGFGTATLASVTLPYCLRVRGSTTNALTPAAGAYTDTVNVSAQYPNSDTGALSPSVPLNYTANVSSACFFTSTPGNMTFNYTAFRTTALTATNNFNLRCTTALPWSVSVSPNVSTTAGLNYSLAVTTPATGAGTGNNANQNVILTGTMAAGQAGSCATATCTGTRAHTITITY